MRQGRHAGPEGCTSTLLPCIQDRDWGHAAKDAHNTRPNSTAPAAEHARTAAKTQAIGRLWTKYKKEGAWVGSGLGIARTAD